MNYQNASSMAQIETKLVDARQRSKTLLFHQQTAADLAWGTDKYYPDVSQQCMQSSSGLAFIKA